MNLFWLLTLKTNKKPDIGGSAWWMEDKERNKIWHDGEDINNVHAVLDEVPLHGGTGKPGK